jgi:ribulose kinase
VRGDYLVRQFGVVPTPSGHVGVALAAQAHAFEGGVSALDAMTDWLVARLPALTEQ